MDEINTTSSKEADLLPGKLVIWAAISILVIGLMIAVAGIYPVYKILIHQQNYSLKIQSESIATLIREYLNRTIDVTLQVTSRTKAREKLEDYNNGRVTMEELKKFSTPVLTDALKLSNSMQGITRLDAIGEIVVQVGRPLPETLLKHYPEELEETILEGPVMIGNQYLLIVYAPIRDRYENKDGIDIVSYDFNELHTILTKYTTKNLLNNVYLFRENYDVVEPIFTTNNSEKFLDKHVDVKSVLSKISNMAETEDNGIFQLAESNGKKYVESYYLIKSVGWLLLIKVNKEKFYAPINREVRNYLLMLLLISMLGSITIYLFLRPLSNRLVTLTNKLRAEINDRKITQQYLATRAHQQAVVAEIGQLALSGIELKKLFDAVVRYTAETLNVEYCKILEILPGKPDLLLNAGVGWKKGLVGKAVVSRDLNSQAGYTLQSHKPVIVEDLRTESRFNGPKLLTDHNVVSGASVIIGNKDAWGVLGVHTSKKRLFTQDDINFIQAIANYLAQAIQRKSAEEDYIKGQIRYQTLYNDNPSMFFTVSQEGTILSVNEYGADCLGYDINGLLGQPFSTIFYDEDKTDALNYIQNCLKQPETIHRLETRKVRRDGSVMWVRETARVVNSEDGHPAIFIVCEDISEARTLSEKLSYQASHDPLTGLVNRHEFELRMTKALETAREQQIEHAMCYLDLDQFKVINDTCGHAAGDQLLKQISNLLQNHVRKSDTLARLGGDEFGLLMEYCDLKRAEQIARKLIEVIGKYRFCWQQHTLNVGVSIGLIPINRFSSSTTELLSMVDRACYAAKDAGRNRIHIYQEDDTDMAQRHGEMQWVAKINAALDEDRFQIYAQKIISLNPDVNNTHHAELLIRMTGEDGSIIMPGKFLLAAERYNLAYRLDQWVIKTIFNYLNLYPQLYMKLGICSINLSGQSIANPDFHSFIISHLKKMKIKPEMICFEITETSAIANLNEATKFINALKQQGCYFALDDFGSGLSSFAYLKALPVDYLKIDGIFVKDIANDPSDYAMVKSIHEIGKSLGKLTIAEFVENKEIMEKLKLVGVNFAQGYAIDKPQPLTDYLT